MDRKRILTGDRITGPLHLGHYFGSLVNRVRLQDEYETFIIAADWQALYDHLEDDRGRGLQANIRGVVLDNLAAGLDPDKATFFIQSEVPELAELTLVFQFLVTVARAKRNPTIKREMVSSGLARESDIGNGEAWGLAADRMNVGFLAFPISQAADILLFKASLVPVGEDQLPHIEQAREIARKFNRLFGETFPEPEGLLSSAPRLRGLDGQAKMSKSLGNAIALSASRSEVEAAVRKAFSGEGHALGEWAELVGLDWRRFESHGELRMREFKPALAGALNDLLEPMRLRRAEFASRPGFIRELLHHGRERARAVARETMREVRARMGMEYTF